MEKSHVGMGFHVCPICTVEHDEVVLLDKRLRKSLEHKNFVGWKACSNCEQKKNEGYIALVGIDPTQSKAPYLPDTVYRTGAVAHLKKHVFKDLFNAPIPDNDEHMCFVDNEVIEMLQKIPVAS